MRLGEDPEVTTSIHRQDHLVWSQKNSCVGDKILVVLEAPLLLSRNDGESRGFSNAFLVHHGRH